MHKTRAGICMQDVFFPKLQPGDVRWSRSLLHALHGLGALRALHGFDAFHVLVERQVIVVRIARN